MRKYIIQHFNIKKFLSFKLLFVVIDTHSLELKTIWSQK